MFEAAPPSSLTGRKNYRGVSKRIKKNVVKRLLQDESQEKSGLTGRRSRTH